MNKALLILGLLTFASISPIWADMNCGDDGLTCGDSERCCEHVIAMFTDDHATTPPYVQCQCVPKTQKCGDFWCGNKQCKIGFFGSPSVCCVNQPQPNSAPKYACAFSELSCPGNSDQLSIRSSTPTRTLQR